MKVITIQFGNLATINGFEKVFTKSPINGFELHTKAVCNGEPDSFLAVSHVLALVAYRLELPEQLSRIHNTFYVSNLKKCQSDETLAIPLDEIQIDNKLQFGEEPVKIMDREVKHLKQSRIPIVKVRWNSRRGPEFTCEHEDQMQNKYPHLFANSVYASNATS
ncbi:hypothetical protein Tco_1569456 [Tanacetum coccineum]